MTRRSSARLISLLPALVLGVGAMKTWAQEGLQCVEADNVQAYDDLRGIILERCGVSLAMADLRGDGDVLTRVTFDTRTIWPPKGRLPLGFDPQKILERGKNPGLGVRHLHGQGITGAGVNVAIIDQPLLRNHKEYAAKVARYTEIDCAGARPEMHGAAVTSLLLGRQCGVAPNVALYYWAEPSWKRDYTQRTEALRQILKFNADKPLAKRIRVVSVSIGFNRQFRNLDSWKVTLREAKAQGLIVVHCGELIHGASCPLDRDPDDPANYEICHFARESSRRSGFPGERLYLPIDHRTTAGFQGPEDYAFFAEGGLSWAAPYLAGVIALGYQVDPTLDSDRIFAYLRETGTPFGGQGRIVNPPRFIAKVRERSEARSIHKNVITK